MRNREHHTLERILAAGLLLKTTTVWADGAGGAIWLVFFSQIALGATFNVLVLLPWSIVCAVQRRTSPALLILFALSAGFEILMLLAATRLPDANPVIAAYAGLLAWKALLFALLRLRRG